MPRTAAGLLMYRRAAAGLEVLLVHPGGPYWAKKDDGAWSIPKGELGPGEEPLAAAQREFREETGFDACAPYVPLGELRQPSGKRIAAWAFAGDCDAAAVRSNTFLVEWPPRSGREQAFPEVDRAQWFPLAEAAAKLVPGQRPFLERLAQAIDPLPGDAATAPRRATP
jgi:predicted NUDIX family NTP pyrophosphohydrolase